VLNGAHPIVVFARSGGGRRTRYVMITFNGTRYYEPVVGAKLRKIASPSCKPTMWWMASSSRSGRLP
jgi:hypothetical protein